MMRWDLIIDRRVTEIPERRGNFVMGGLALAADELDYCVELLSMQSGVKGIFFENCSIDNTGLEALLPLFKNSNIEQIGLVGNKIDSKGVLNLVEVLLSVKDSKLKNLYLKDCCEIDELGVSALMLLKASLPDLKIEGLPIPGFETKPDFKDVISDIKKRVHYNMPINEAYSLFKEKILKPKA